MSEFAGLRIEGTIDPGGRSQTPQLPKEDLAEPLRACIAHPRFVAIHWHQYTPYFNDGEPCYFSVGDIFFRILREGEESVDLDAERERLEEEGTWRYMDDGADEWYITSELVVGEQRYDYESRTYKITEPPPEGVDEIRHFAELLRTGSYENALHQLFGDHADILITRDKIVVEMYEHE